VLTQKYSDHFGLYLLLRRVMSIRNHEQQQMQSSSSDNDEDTTEYNSHHLDPTTCSCSSSSTLEMDYPTIFKDSETVVDEEKAMKFQPYPQAYRDCNPLGEIHSDADHDWFGDNNSRCYLAMNKPQSVHDVEQFDYSIFNCMDAVHDRAEALFFSNFPSLSSVEHQNHHLNADNYSTKEKKHVETREIGVNTDLSLMWDYFQTSE
jgi:hypothetical protein